MSDASASPCPVAAKIAATIGDEADVPPYTAQPPLPYWSYTATPVLGSATAEISATVRMLHPPSLCQDGLGSNELHPEPVPPLLFCASPHTLSVHPRDVDDDGTSEVPPTAMTYCDAAGYSAP